MSREDAHTCIDKSDIVLGECGAFYGVSKFVRSLSRHVKNIPLPYVETLSSQGSGMSQHVNCRSISYLYIGNMILRACLGRV